jgi:hypothetical protein
MKGVSDKSWRETQNTHCLFNNIFLQIMLFEIKWKNILDLGRPQKTIWGTRTACWIPTATNTLSEYAIILFFHWNNDYKNAPY